MNINIFEIGAWSLAVLILILGIAALIYHILNILSKSQQILKTIQLNKPEPLMDQEMVRGCKLIKSSTDRTNGVLVDTVHVEVMCNSLEESLSAVDVLLQLSEMAPKKKDDLPKSNNKSLG